MREKLRPDVEISLYISKRSFLTPSVVLFLTGTPYSHGSGFESVRAA